MFLSLFAVTLAPLKFFPLSPSLRLKLHGAPLVMLTHLYFFLSRLLFLSFLFLFPFFSSFFFLSFSLSLCVSFPFFFLSFWRHLGWPRRARTPKTPKIRQYLYVLFIHPSPYASYFSLSSLLESFNLYYRKFKVLEDAVYSLHFPGQCHFFFFFPFFLIVCLFSIGVYLLLKATTNLSVL